MSKVDAYAVGFCCASVCAPKTMTITEVTDELNALHPTGITSAWQLSPDAKFKGGEPNPCRCDEDEGKLHYLFHC